MSPDVLTVTGGSPLRGSVRVPGDKGISHRALLFGALATGTSRIRGLATGGDVASTARVLRALGVEIDDDGDLVVVEGRGPDGLREPSTVLDCGNSGTSIRTLAGLLSGRPFLSVLTGDDSLVTRPMARVVDPLRSMGARIDARAGGTLPPLVIRADELRGIEHVLPVASAQVKTALVLAGMQAAGTTRIVEPLPSRDHTERMLAALGVPLVRVDDRTIEVTAGMPHAFSLTVPGDPSSTAFWAVAAAITPGSELTLVDVLVNPTRIAFLDVLQRMGADIEIEETGAELGEPLGTVTVRASELHGTDVGGAEIPNLQDEIPVLAVAAAHAEGVTRFSDAGELRVKETDRIETVADVVRAMGVGVETGPDSLVVRGGRPTPGAFSSAGDHRIALAAAVAACATPGTSHIEGWDAVAVSYPSFADELAALQDA